MIDRSSEGAAEPPSAALQRLQRALDERGIAARVEERAALAIIVPRGTATSATSATSNAAVSSDPDVRQWLVQAALAAGFSHVALEIVPSDESHAALPGCHPA